MAYWYFLSYAHADAWGSDANGNETVNPLVEKFLRDLAERVAQDLPSAGKVKPGEVGFYDRKGIEVGGDWRADLLSALRTSKVFISLYSRAYFNSNFCGKEVQLFRSRVHHYAQQKGVVPRLIIPVLWSRPDRMGKLPQSMERLQYTHADFGQLYSHEGLRYLLDRMPGQEETKAYKDFLDALVERIVDEPQRHDLPALASAPELQKIQSAFDDISQPQPVDGNGALMVPVAPAAPVAIPPPRNMGMNIAWLVHVAGRKDHYKTCRKSIDCYGDLGGRDWRPYHPPDKSMLYNLTARMFAEQSELVCEDVEVSEQLVGHLQDAEDNNTMAILLVDPWSVCVEAFKKFLTAYDKARLTNCRVIVLWNEQDEETKGAAQKLEADLKGVLSRMVLAADSNFRFQIKSPADLVKELKLAVTELRDRIDQRRKLLRPVDAGGQAPPPTF